MFRRVSVLALLVLLVPIPKGSLGIFSDSPVLQSFIQNFNESDISIKTDILRNISADSALEEYAGQFYTYALQYALDNYSFMEIYSGMNDIIVISVHGLRNTYGIRNTGCSECLDVLWELFLEYPVSETRAEILITIGIIGKGNRDIIDNVNNYLANINSLFNSGSAVNYTIVSACIAALMELGDSSSYPVLFTVMNSRYPEMIVWEATGAFDLIQGNLFQFLFGVIENNPPHEKLIAFRAAASSRQLSVSELGQIAQLAFDLGMAAGDEDADFITMRYEAVPVLARLRWAGSNTLVISHYYWVYDSFMRGDISKNRLIEAINCLGAVGDSHAALVLGLQLGLINIRKESTGIFDADITLAIIQALGLIGDNAVFAHLFYASNLSYGEHITAAARDAIDRLKW